MHIITQKLQDLKCSITAFVLIAGLIGRTRMTQCLQGEQNFDHNVEDKLLRLLEEMAELKRTSPIMPDWDDAENIREVLRTRREIKLAFNYDSDNLRKFLEVSDATSDS